MRGLVVPSVLLLVTGCASAPHRSVPAALAAPPVEATPIAHADSAPPGLPDVVPLSIKRLVSEQRTEIDDIRALIAPMQDPRGRARATNDADALAGELEGIESDLRVTAPDSAHYDATVVQLQLLSTKTGLMHEALRGALATTALELEGTP